MKNTDTTPQAVQACHELLRWLIPHLDKFVVWYEAHEQMESAIMREKQLKNGSRAAKKS